MTQISAIAVVYFHDLEFGFLETEGFNSFSYGDADQTLVAASTLAHELESRNDDSLRPLIDELLAVPEDVLVAFEG